MTVTFCPRCGKARSQGRNFCAACGTRFSDAGAPAPVGITPPPLPGSKPLFADEMIAPPPSSPPAGSSPTSTPTVTTPLVVPPVAPPPWTDPPPAPSKDAPGRRRSRGLLGALVALLLVAVMALGWWVFLRGDEPPAAGTGAPSRGAQPGPSGSPSDTGAPTDQPVRPTGPSHDISALARPEASRTAPDGEEAGTGARVSYGAANMLDQDPSTGWRVNTDGTGTVLTFTFPAPVRLDRVALINGYAKTVGREDYYRLYRRITRATWTFDDGSRTVQEFTDSRELQPIDVDVVTTRVRLRIDEVSGIRDPDKRDRTTISEVAFTGSAD